MRDLTYPFVRLLSLLPLVLLLSTPALAQDDQLTCPDANLTEYLISLIDTLYWNGLTTFEEFVVALSETDNGYEYLQSLYTSGQKNTILVPTDAAFQAAGIWSSSHSNSSSALSAVGNEEWLVDLISLHTLQGDWNPSSIDFQGGGGGVIASTWLSTKDEMNNTTSQSQAFQAVVLIKGGDGDGSGLQVDGWWVNGTTWSGPVTNGGSGGVLNNLVLLPIDTVLPFPPNLSTALTTSGPGFSNFSSALDVVGSDTITKLEQLTDNGFTIFVPIDEGWSDEVRGMMNDEKMAKGIVMSHYTTNYTLFSPSWSTAPFTLTLDSGATLTISLDTDGITPLLAINDDADADGDQQSDESNGNTTARATAKILQSDITLENGVMHIIDTVLVPPSLNNTQSNATDTSSSTSTETATATAFAVATASATGDLSPSSNAGVQNGAAVNTGSQSSLAPKTVEDMRVGVSMLSGLGMIVVAILNM
ncbi:hypothetical protein CI109_103473 [Kwoniella shandongensis]|uniref:Uncharacterized protein n=1 Tax=Kwoniella shandongensis TaxID=1734106 RepID=A0A5M6BW41_9TREE|nr:uncharacterized protein CI109_004624 [Kwoniella shandongensis]KAA5527088.1 hypothetical protein CI109_004624 [Kwoniella shandongensis]